MDLNLKINGIFHFKNNTKLLGGSQGLITYLSDFKYARHWFARTQNPMQISLVVLNDKCRT